MKYSDQQIVDAISLAKDRERILTYLYKTHLPVIERVVKRSGGATEDAHDVFQEALLVFYKKAMTGEFQIPQYNIKNFLIGVTKNMWISRVRKIVRAKEKEATITEQYYSYDEVNMPIEAEEKRLLIDELLKSVGEKCYQLLKKTIYHGLSMKEISKELGYSSEDTAKTIHYRCKQKLMKLYKDRQDIKQVLAYE